MKRQIIYFLVMLLVGGGVFFQSNAAAANNEQAEQLFVRRIAPLFHEKCLACHGKDEAQAKEIAKANSEKWSAEDGVTVKTSGGLSPEWTDRKYKTEGLWAYQPVRKPTLPGVERHPIDSFVTAMMPAGLQPAPAADRVTLIRRATFDLIGLPPTPEKAAAFVKDSRPDAEAFAKVVDRLLDSPHYGERMAQN